MVVVLSPPLGVPARWPSVHTVVSLLASCGDLESSRTEPSWSCCRVRVLLLDTLEAFPGPTFWDGLIVIVGVAAFVVVWRFFAPGAAEPLRVDVAASEKTGSDAEIACAARHRRRARSSRSSSAALQASSSVILLSSVSSFQIQCIPSEGTAWTLLLTIVHQRLVHYGDR